MDTATPARSASLFKVILPSIMSRLGWLLRILTILRIRDFDEKPPPDLERTHFSVDD